MEKRGLLIVLSGPSGVGKGTVRQAIFEKENLSHELVYSISATTRTCRDGEQDGRDYFFKTRQEFEQMIKHGQMLEYAEYVGNYYGTPIDYVEEMLSKGKDVFLEIEVNGAIQVRSRMPEGIFIFLTPPDLQELERRLIGRGTDDTPVIEKRIQKAKEELALMKHYDYAVVNDDVDTAVDKIMSIIHSEHLKVTRVLDEWNRG
ncbi:MULTISPECIES: guanylate kinase [unclassified Granulicatella]|uniref:guanylate kinase n=1 Tax=unclassified Granulicatella TaxID=2630493 RepID=UPI00107389CD|nr:MULTISPECIES: guanylate kinase [unclassified Granulicatella]MBF0780718.1 guanylate kinase [Granulicatella sp. 19428wC4_WM01]TFU94210.1 guanylate kinase [Granulicatella sp. WM01]